MLDTQNQKEKNDYAKIKTNILELILDNNALYSEEKIKRKGHSQPGSKNIKKKYQKKPKNKKAKREDSQKDIIKQENNESFDANLNIEKDIKKLINSNERKKENNKSNNKNAISDNKKISKDSQDNINININEKNEKLSNNELLNLNNQRNPSIDVSSNPNSSNNINFSNNLNSNTNKSNTNYAFNFFGVSSNVNNNTLEDNSSLNSSKNELSSKNVKLGNANNRVSNLSSSSFGKNFVLKSEICKSTFHKEKRYIGKNTYSEENPIINYYTNDINGKNFGNFYLFTDRKSIEEIDQNQYQNFFPQDDIEQKKSKNIMSCNYVDSKLEMPEQITTDIINENIEQSNEYNFNLNEFHVGTNNEEKINLENIIKKEFMGLRNRKENNKNIDIDDSNNVRDKIKDIIEKNNENAIVNNKDSNENNNNNNKEEKPSNKFSNISINDNSTNTNITYSNISDMNSNNNIDNKKYDLNNKMPFSFVNNIYNINNSNFKQYQMNPLMNPGMPNYFYNPNMNNMNANPFMNYYNTNYPTYNYYNQLYNKNIPSQNDYFNSTNNNANKKVIENNNINDNNLNKNNMNNNMNNNNNIYNNSKSNNSPYINKNFYELTDEEIINLSCDLIKDQLGCRFMQEKIKSNHQFANELLFPKIKFNLKELCCDNFGNYFLQVLVDILSFDNINKFFDITQNDFTEICISPHGTRVIQKIIDKISATPILMNRFIYNLNSKDLGIIFKSPYGNHMIQKFLGTIHASEYSIFIYNYVYKYFLDIADSKHGVCVIQKCVTEGEEKQRAKLYELILNNFNNLIKDQFGNYLIQYILINTKTEDKFKEILPIIYKIEENMVNFCKSKYSANVIEKCFENCENMIREHILNSLLTNNSENIVDILIDQYGIYVIQKAFKINNIIYKNKLIEIINSKEKELKKINFADYKYKNILKIINSNKELGEIFSKILKNEIQINNPSDNHNYHKENNNNEYYNYNMRGKNKKGRKYNRGNNYQH